MATSEDSSETELHEEQQREALWAVALQPDAKNEVSFLLEDMASAVSASSTCQQAENITPTACQSNIDIRHLKVSNETILILKLCSHT